jgi:hypothetical protein
VTKEQVFSNKWLLLGEIVVKGISLEENEDDWEKERAREEFLKGKFYSYIGEKFNHNCFIFTNAPRPYYFSREGEYLVRPGMTDQMLNDVFRHRKFKPYEDEGRIMEEIERWTAGRRSELIYINAYISKSMGKRMGAALDSVRTSLSSTVNGYLKSYDDVMEKVKGARDMADDPAREILKDFNP